MKLKKRISSAALACWLAFTENFRALLLVAGIALIARGAWLIYAPAGYVVLGVILAVIAIVGHQRGGSDDA